MPGLDRMYCGLCQKPHKSKRLEQGWFARGFRRGIHGDSAKRLICPECLKRIIPGSIEG